MQPQGLPLYFSQPPKRYDLFISHSWDYGDDRVSLEELIVNGLGNECEIYNHSATQDDPIHTQTGQELVAALRSKVASSNVLVFPAGVYATYSDWIPIEIALAQELGKPIIAVEKWGSQRNTVLVNAANDIVGWNSTSIANSIRSWHP